jgi:Bax protein
MRLTEKTAILGMSLAMVVLPAGLALALVEQARASLVTPQRIQYLRHQAPAETVGELQTSLSYKVSEIGQGDRLVPRVFLARLPTYLGDLPPIERKAMFTAAILPLILRANELLIEDRQRLEDIRQRTIDGASDGASDGARIEDWEVQWSLRKARAYGIGEPQGLDDVDWQALLARLDIIPPSLAVAQAANESGWGTSRFAREGNAIFGQWTFGKGPGMIPANRRTGSDHKVRRFNFLIESVLGYAQNLNTHEAYEDFRRLRGEGRTSGAFPTGLALAGTLVNYSVRGEAYVEEIRGIININAFGLLDGAQLMSARGLGAR